MICSRTVFRCFKTLERLGDRVTGAAGPFFVALAIILMSIGTVAFCAWLSRSFTCPDAGAVDVISPSLPFPLLTIPLCVLVAVNMWTHYWWVCTVPPGFIDGDVSPIRGLWAAKRKTRRRQCKDDEGRADKMQQMFHDEARTRPSLSYMQQMRTKVRSSLSCALHVSFLLLYYANQTVVFVPHCIHPFHWC